MEKLRYHVTGSIERGQKQPIAAIIERKTMKQNKTTGIYKMGEARFNPETLEATSYNWWVFLKLINGKLVFNSFRYSNTTARHQWNVRKLLENLGIKIDIEIETKKSLSDDLALDDAIERMIEEIHDLKKQIEKPRSKDEKNVERRLEIRLLNRKIKTIKEELKK